MKRLIVVFSIFSCLGLVAQDRLKPVSHIETYVSKKKTYAINYNPAYWQVSHDSSEWDVEFHDAHNLLQVYFSSFSYFIPKDKLKETIKSQYAHIGKVKNLKIYKKRLSHMEVDYFECELLYEGYRYAYQGFVFDGESGSAQLQFGGQVESIQRAQGRIDEFCNGVVETR